jgi:[ribosomal protein S18]-alanine N-acetyltransferase
MSAQPKPALSFRSMRPEDVAAVVAIENSVYPFPWTRGNFIDSLSAKNHCCLCVEDDRIIGYAVMMPAGEEAHLLNLTVAGEWQGRGLGRTLLEHVIQLARNEGGQTLLLEVRPSNQAAQALYQQIGFRAVGVRRGYYPAGSGREDALVMRLAL